MRSIEVLDLLLRSIVRRWIYARVARCVAWCSLAGGALGVLYLFFLKGWGTSHDPAFGWLFFWTAGVILGLFLACRRIPRPQAAAKMADDRLGLKDRLSGAHSYLAGGMTGEWVDLAVADALAHAERIRPADVVPRPRWIALLAGVLLVPFSLYQLQMIIFPPPPPRVVETVSELELGAALSSLDAALEDPQTFQQLQEDLKKLGVSETTEKSELLARLNRTIAELQEQAHAGEEVLTTLEQMEKLKARLGLTQLQQRADAELRQVEELVTDAGVKAEVIYVDPLVDTSRAREVAQGLKQVAAKQLEPVDGADRPVAAAEGGIAQRSEAPPSDGGEASRPEAEGAVASKNLPGVKKKSGADDLAALAMSDEEIRQRILHVARAGDRGSKDYDEVYRNYRRAFLAELFRTDLGRGRREYLERYFHAIRPEESKPQKK